MMKRLLSAVAVVSFLPVFGQFSGNALDFDGVNDMVVSSTVPTCFSTPATSDFTIEAWVYPRGNAFQRILFAQPSTTNFCSFGVSTGNVIYFYVIENGTTYSVATSAGIAANQWTHVAARWTTSSNSVQVFYNGVLQAGAAGGTSSTGTSGLMVLGSRPGGFQYFNGMLDEVRVWSEARTDCEIQNNMNKSLTGPETNLVTDYNFNQGTAGGNNAGIITLPDLSGQNHNGTLTNFTLTGTTSNWVSSAATVTSSGASVSGYAYSETATVCSGGSYTFPDGTTQTNITSATSHVSTIIGGCDTIITTTVNVNPVYTFNDTASVCSGGSFTFPDATVFSNITSDTSHASMLLTVAGCDSVINTVVTVRQPSSSNSSVTVCYGDSVTFPDGSGMIITGSGTQMSTLVNAVGCDSVIMTIYGVNPVYSDTDSVWICYNGNYTFPDGTSISGVTSATSHLSTLSSVNSCDSTIFTELGLIQVDTAVTVVNETMTATATGVSYQWIDCGNGNQPIVGETNQSYTATANGSYAVIIDNNGCMDTSSCILILSTGIEAESTVNISVYPNPVSAILNLSLESSVQSTLEIISVNGEVVQTKKVSGQQVQLDVSELAAGVYLLRVTQGEMVYLKQFQRL